MRVAVIIAAVAVLALSTGCEWLDRMRPKSNDVPSGPVQGKTSTELVSYLNGQSKALNSVRYSDASIEVYVGKENYTPTDSSLVVATPRNFLLVGGRHVMANLVNIGSNSQEFWMYSRFPEQNYVVCSHADFPTAGNKLPFPFDPDWALQALGMTEYPPDLIYTVEKNERQRELWLSFDTKTPQGTPVKRVVVFAAEPMNGSQPQIRRHLILDSAGKTIATAEVREVSTMQVGLDPQTRKPMYAQVPTRVSLDWPQQQFKMELKLPKPRVNEMLTDAETAKLFARPAIDGVNPINLAQVRFDPSSVRGSTPGNSTRPFGSK